MPHPTPSPVFHRETTVLGRRLFYREAGSRQRPTLLLLHGFPSSSHMFRGLMPRLAGDYHLLAPDLPGFGFSERPATGPEGSTFAQLTDAVEAFVDAQQLDRVALYVFDYGAPVGFRLALRRPELVAAIVTQNGNAYEEGLGPDWAPLRAYWAQPTAAHREALRGFLSPETTRWQYTHGAHDPAAVAPEAYTLDALLMQQPGNAEHQLDLFRDYAGNVAMYPEFQRYFRERRPPLLAVWGRHDPFFLPAGALAYRRDLPDAEVHLLDAGHFALETRGDEIAARMLDFLHRRLPGQPRGPGACAARGLDVATA